MGSCKFLVVFISVLSALALVVLGASAVEPNVKAVNDSGASKAAPTSAPAIQSKLFDPIYVMATKAEGSTSWGNYFSSIPQDVNSAYVCTSFYLYRDGQINVYRENPDGALVYYDSSTGYVFFGEESFKPSRPDFGNWEIRLTSDVEFNPRSGYFNYYTVAPLLGFISGFVSTLFSVGGQVIAFVISHWVVALPLVAFVLVICISVIRRLVKGV